VAKGIKDEVSKFKGKVNHLQVFFRVPLIQKKLDSTLAYEFKIIVACLFEELPVAEINTASLVM
jgi:hypothetical protein